MRNPAQKRGDRYMQALYSSAGFGDFGRLARGAWRSGWLCGGCGFMGWVGSCFFSPRL